LGFMPKKRANRPYPSWTTKPPMKEAKVGEFAGYKVGMTQVKMIDDRKGSPTFNQEVVAPCTILEVPPLRVFGIRLYKKDVYGPKVAFDVLAQELSKELARRIPAAKKRNRTLAELEKNLEKDGIFSNLHLLVHTQPSKAGIGKKTPEIFEIGIGGASLKEKLAFAKQKLGNEIPISDVFKEGQLVDVEAVTKGFGFQGSIKRWHIKRLPHKSQKIRRKVGTLGPWHPHKTRWTVPQMGQMGYHNRPEYNKRVLKVSADVKEIVNAAGWKNYGVVRNSFMIINGSVPGTTKRLVMMRQALRPYEKERPVVLEEILLKQ